MWHRLFFIFWSVSVVLARSVVAAQDPLNASVPLAIGSANGLTAGDTAERVLAARRALELGFPATAAEIYRELLKRPGTDERLMTLSLAAALIADNRALESEPLLQDFKGYRGAAWHLYAGLAAMQTKRFEPARGELPAVKEKEGELTPEERGWWLYLQGLVAEMGPDRARAIETAKNFYQQAIAAGTSTYARVRFEIAYDQALLRMRAPTPAELEDMRQRMETNAGRDTGYGAAVTYAVGLNAAGRRSDALAVLNQQLLSLPAQERARADVFQLQIGMIAGATDGAGRNALLQLLRSGRDAGRQRIALQLLAEKSLQEPVRGQFRTELSRLIAAPTPHPIYEDLLLFRANFSLAEKNFTAAEEDARTLLDKFPGSALKPLALAVLTSSAWEQKRYRTVVESATRAVDAQSKESSSGKQARAELNLLVAEAWFRAGDFRPAADAYAVVLRDPPAGAKLGDLMFQRVQAEIEAGSPDAAQPVLDALAANPAFDVESRWQAEWNLARALIGRADPEQAAVAYARVNRLLGGPATGLSPELRARMKWLQARLALDIAEPARAREIVTKELPPLLAGLAPALKIEIESAAALLKAEASFALKDEGAALTTLEKLRTDFPKTSAAVASYVTQANYYAEQEKTVEAQQLYIKLAETFPDDEQAPSALYSAALQAERRGQLEGANNLVVDMVRKYPNHALVFPARMKQGDLLRLLNQYPQAQQVYELLVNSPVFSSRPDAVLAQLALADCRNAQSFNDPAQAEAALNLYERVRERVDVPVDVRVEAGYKLGLVVMRKSDLEKAASVWWVDVVAPFLLDPIQAEKLGAKGRRWMALTLLDLGDLRQSQDKLEEAKQAWGKILEAKLPGEAEARMRLAPYGVTGGK